MLINDQESKIFFNPVLPQTVSMNLGWEHNHSAPQFLHQISTVVPMAMRVVLAFHANANDAFDIKVLETFMLILNYKFCWNYEVQKFKFFLSILPKNEILPYLWVLAIVSSMSDYQNFLSHVFFYSCMHAFIQYKLVFTQCSRHYDYLWMEFNKPSRSPITLI